MKPSFSWSSSSGNVLKAFFEVRAQRTGMHNLHVWGLGLIFGTLWSPEHLAGSSSQALLDATAKPPPPQKKTIPENASLGSIKICNYIG